MASVPIRTPRINHITGLIITAAMKVHSLLGPGLLESAYQACLVHELRKQGLGVLTEVELPVIYDGEEIEVGFPDGPSCRKLRHCRSEMCRGAPSHAPGSAALVYAPQRKTCWTPDKLPRLSPSGRYQAHGGRQRLGQRLKAELIPQ
jgi:hypothetical protein